MKTLREVAEAACPHRSEDYDPAIDDMSDEIIRMGSINGFITGAQWRERIRFTPGSVSDPESAPIELCGLLWDRDNLFHRRFPGRTGHRYYTWHRGDGGREVCREAPADPGGMGSIMRSRFDLGRRAQGPLVWGQPRLGPQGLVIPACCGPAQPQMSGAVGQHELLRLLLVLVAVLRRLQLRGQPLLLLGQRQPA